MTDWLKREQTIRELRETVNAEQEAHGWVYYFEGKPKKLLTIHATDDERIRHIKQMCNVSEDGRNLDVGSLYMERNVTAEELAGFWTEQGWTALVVRRGPIGHMGVKFLRSFLKIIRSLKDNGAWVYEPVEQSWSVVIATERPEDIEPFRALLLPSER